jgi:hypothetical protein
VATKKLKATDSSDRTQGRLPKSSLKLHNPCVGRSTLSLSQGKTIGCCWRIKDVSLYDPQAYGPHTFFTTGFPRFLLIRGARGLQAFDLPSHSSYSNSNYD